MSSKKRVKDHNAPLKPLSAYFIFLNDYREIYKSEHPDYSFSELVCGIVETWKSLPLNQKKSFEDRENILKEKYDIDMKLYLKNKL